MTPRPLKCSDGDDAEDDADDDLGDTADSSDATDDDLYDQAVSIVRMEKQGDGFSPCSAA